MATVDITRGVAAARFSVDNLPRFFFLDRVYDFATNNGTSGDTYQVFHVAAGTLVLFAGVEVQVVEDGTATIDMGDGDDDDGYLAARDIEAATGYFVSNLTYTNGTGDLDIATASHAELYGIPGGKLYTSNDTIDVLLNNALDAAKLRFLIAGIDMAGYAS